MQKAKPKAKPDSNVKDKSKIKTLNELKSSINRRLDDVEHNFYLIGLDLIKVHLYTKNFQKWVKENTTMGVSTAYTLMQMVRKDQELRKSKNYKDAKPKLSFYKLTKLLKYPADFIDKLDFKKLYDVPGDKKFNLMEMPRELFAEVIAHEIRMLTAKDRGEDEGFSDVPIDEVIINKAQSKLSKLLSDLQNIVTVLAEVTVTKDSKETVIKAVESLESITSQAENLSRIGSQLLSTLKKQKIAKAA